MALLVASLRIGFVWFIYFFSLIFYANASAESSLSFLELEFIVINLLVCPERFFWFRFVPLAALVNNSFLQLQDPLGHLFLILVFLIQLSYGSLVDTLQLSLRLFLVLFNFLNQSDIISL